MRASFHVIVLIPASQVPQSVTTVVLLGSWDNFRKPYRMEKDFRTGPGHWRGCHSFTDIICDGDSVQPYNGRNGGLKMGGIYWYYVRVSSSSLSYHYLTGSEQYELDDDIEYHNPREASTTSCPLLPGQLVNFLEVPVQMRDEVGSGRSRSASSSSSIFYTLNPNDKYLTPQPPEIPQHLRRTTSPKLANDTHENVEESSRKLSQFLPVIRSRAALDLVKQIGDMSIRASNKEDDEAITKSEPASRRTSVSLGQQTLVRATSAGRIQKARSDSGRRRTPQRELVLPHATCMALTEKDGEVFPNHGISKTPTVNTLLSASRLRPSEDITPSPGPASSTLDVSSLEPAGLCIWPSPKSSVAQIGDTMCRSRGGHEKTVEASCTQPLRIAREQFMLSSDRDIDRIYAQDYTNQKPNDRHPRLLEDGTAATEFCWTHGAHNAPSHNGSSLFSPALSTSSCHVGSMSPYHLSQPETPVLPDFANFLLEPIKIMGSPPQAYDIPYDYHSPAGFDDTPTHDFSVNESSFGKGRDDVQEQGPLSTTDNGSTLTLTKLSSRTSKAPIEDGSIGRKSGKSLADGWDDGIAEQPKTVLQELFDDLGYLARMID